MAQMHPVLVTPSGLRTSESVVATSQAAGLVSVGLSRATFGCEGEDALLTGMTRSPLRRLLGLNVDSLRAQPVREPLPVAVAARRIA